MKLRFGLTKVRYRGLRKNLPRLLSTCALANLTMAATLLPQGLGQSCA